MQSHDAQLAKAVATAADLSAAAIAIAANAPPLLQAHLLPQQGAAAGDFSTALPGDAGMRTDVAALTVAEPGPETGPTNEDAGVVAI